MFAICQTYENNVCWRWLTLNVEELSKEVWRLRNLYVVDGYYLSIKLMLNSCAKSINPSYVTGLFLYSMKTSIPKVFWYFQGVKKRSVSWNGLISHLLIYEFLRYFLSKSFIPLNNESQIKNNFGGLNKILFKKALRQANNRTLVTKKHMEF